MKSLLCEENLLLLVMMASDENIINIEAYEFVEKIKVVTETIQPINNYSGSFEHQPYEDLPFEAVEDQIFFEQRPIDELNYEIVARYYDRTYFFESNDYKRLLKIVNKILKLKNHENVINEDYLIKKIFHWIIEIIKQNRASSDLLAYIDSYLESDVREYTFYFPILNLNIYKIFHIGDVEFTYFTKEYFDAYWEKYKDKGFIKEEEFNSIFRKYQGRVFASCKIKAQYDTASEIAFNTACIATDALKMYTPTMFYPSLKCAVDLEKRININYYSDFLSMPTDSEGEISITESAHNDVYFFDEERMRVAFETGLTEFSILFKLRQPNELQSLIKQSITLLSSALSVHDLHIRIIHLIMITESLFIEQDKKSGFESKVKGRITKLLFLQNPTMDRKRLNKSIEHLYNVRNKMVHKAIKLEINLTHLRDYQVSFIEILAKTSIFSQKIKDKNAFITFLDGENTT